MDPGVRKQLLSLPTKRYDAKFVHAEVGYVEDEQLAQLLSPVGWRLRALLRVYHYSPGDRFDWHQDPSFDSSTHTYLFSLLAENLEGGETEFEDGTRWVPIERTELIFPHYLLHRGREVVKGKKVVLRGDLWPR